MNSTDLDEPTVSQVFLDKIRFGVRQYVSREIFQTLTIEQIPDFGEAFGREIGYEIRGWIWGKQHPREPIVYPRDWWQALKERFAPVWFIRRWPVVYTIVSLNMMELYPNLQPSLPGGHLRLHVQTNEYGLTAADKTGIHRV